MKLGTVSKGGDRAGRILAVGRGCGAERGSRAAAPQHSRQRAVRRHAGSRRPQGDGDRQRRHHHRHRRRSAAGADPRRQPGASSRPRRCERLRAAGAAQPDRRDAADPGGRAQQEIESRTREIDQYYRALRPELQPDARRRSPPICARSARRSARSSARSAASSPGSGCCGRKIEPFVNVGDDEVQALIDAPQRVARHAGISGRRDLHLGDAGDRRRGAAPTPRGSSSRSARARTFAAYARQFSEASTAAVGGDLGWVRAEQLPRSSAAVVTADAGRRDQRPDRGPRAASRSSR